MPVLETGPRIIHQRAPAVRRNMLRDGLLGEPQDSFQLVRIESDDGLAVDDGHRGRPEPQFDQLLEGRLIRADILDRERHAVLRKKLFLSVTGPSAGL